MLVVFQCIYNAARKDKSIFKKVSILLFIDYYKQCGSRVLWQQFHSCRVSELCEYVLLLFPFWTESLVNHFGSDEFRIKKHPLKCCDKTHNGSEGEKKKQASVSVQLLMSYAARLVVVFISSQQKHALSEHLLVSGKTNQELYYSLSVGDSKQQSAAAHRH